MSLDLRSKAGARLASTLVEGICSVWGTAPQEVQLAGWSVRNTAFCPGTYINCSYEQLSFVGSMLCLDFWLNDSYFKGQMDICRQNYSSRYIGNKNIMNEMETLAKGVGKQMG